MKAKGKDDCYGVRKREEGSTCKDPTFWLAYFLFIVGRSLRSRAPFFILFLPLQMPDTPRGRSSLRAASLVRVHVSSRWWPIDLIHNARHLCTRLRSDGIKAMSRGFSRGKQVINVPNTRNRSWVCLFLPTENEQLFVLKLIMANYGWRWSLLLF